MSENVFLFGAGASHAAGIPLLSDFMQTIRRLAATGVSGNRELTGDEIRILERAVEIRNDMREYTATVEFNQFSIEDILSILSFDELAGSKEAKEKIADFTAAISLAIELTCSVSHDGNLRRIENRGPEEYRKFWQAVFRGLSRQLQEIPSIITFNYDLVLERSLLQTVIGHPIEGFREALHGKFLSVVYGHGNLERLCFQAKTGGYGDIRQPQTPGIYLQTVAPKTIDPNKTIEIPIIKPHGSLNFPSEALAAEPSLISVTPNAAILPPVFNKASSAIGAPIWRAGLEALRECRNLIVCGYSLPITDTYMQYFLKSALGPNPNLDQIFVFDPCLFDDPERGAALRSRYSKCFSSSFQPRIEFNPSTEKIKSKPGTFAHLAELLLARPEYLLFGISPEPGFDMSTMRASSVPRRRKSRFDGLM